MTCAIAYEKDVCELFAVELAAVEVEDARVLSFESVSARDRELAGITELADGLLDVSSPRPVVADEEEADDGEMRRLSSDFPLETGVLARGEALTL